MYNEVPGQIPPAQSKSYARIVLTIVIVIIVAVCAVFAYKYFKSRPTADGHIPERSVENLDMEEILQTQASLDAFEQQMVAKLGEVPTTTVSQQQLEQDRQFERRERTHNEFEQNPDQQLRYNPQ